MAPGNLEFFATDEVVAELEAKMASMVNVETVGEQTSMMVTLAWQIRQRDSARALLLAAESESSLDGMELPSNERARILARLGLIRAEVHWLFARLPAALELASRAKSEFIALGDTIGCADAHWLLAMLAIDQGDWPGKRVALESMALSAGESCTIRVAAAHAADAYFSVFRARADAEARWGAHFALGKNGLHPSAGCWAEDFLAVCAHHASEFAPAIRHFIDAYTLALQSGQLRRAVIAATNTGDALNHLNDYHGALEWMQRGLNLARKTSWPGSMGVALLQTAHTMRLLNRLDAARELLQEALSLMQPLAASRNYAYALWHLSEVELASKDYLNALDTSKTLAERADALQQADLQSSARCVQARALLALNQPEEAIVAAELARHLGHSSAKLQMDALYVLSDIHVAHVLPAPPNATAPSAALHYLQLALDLSKSIENMITPGTVFEAMAKEHARIGDYEQAYEFSTYASVAREKTHTQEASNRAVAMQVVHETEKARAEGKHQRSLAQAQADRLEVLERLGAIGREITGNLDLYAIFNALNKHVHALFDASTFIIYRLSTDSNTLHMAFGIEAAQALAPHSIQVDDPNRHAARCAREKTEILTEVEHGLNRHLPSTLETVSLMYAPLLLAERLVGVMTIQSVVLQSYAEREVAIFRALCAYVAIALANADARALLVEKNRQLEVVSVSDPLTGLFNRLRLDQVLQEEVTRGLRSDTQLSVVLMDLDHFKSVNDNHGHQVGDQVLIAVANLLLQGAREIDVVGRWGGEEFLVVCRDTDLDGAVVLAHKLCALVAEHAFPVVGQKTGSFGVGCLRQREDANTLIARADAALYRAKHSGRNRVEIST